MNIFAKNLIIVLSVLLYTTAVKAQRAPNVTDTLGQKQGHWIKLDGNQKKIYDGNFLNNIPTGKFTYFYETGEPKAVTVFSQNGKIAYTQRFNITGKLIGEGKYINEKKDSLWKFYDDEGKLVSDEMYLNDLKNGSCKVYYSNGQVSENKMWSHGVLNGACIKYFESGKIKSQFQYVNDKVDGKATFYYPSGNVYADGFYKDDLKDRTWKFYKEDNTLKKTVVYRNGQTSDKEAQGIISKEEDEKARKQYEGSDSNGQPKEQ